MTFSVKAALDAWVATQGRVWEHDRLATVGASEIGACERRTWYAKNETPHDEGYVDRWGPKVRGTLYEDTLFVPAMQTLDMRKYDAWWYGREQKTISSGFLSATPDCLITGVETDECFLIELKTIDPRVDLRKARDAHAYQVQVQMGLVREFTNHKPTHAVVAYLDASFPDDVTEFRVDFDQRVYDAAVARARGIMAARNALDLKPEGAIAGGKECDSCPFSRRCRGDAAAGHPNDEGPLSKEDADALVSLIEQHEQYEQDIDMITERLGETRHSIKELLRAANLRWTEVDGPDNETVRKISWQSRNGKVTYDLEAMRRDNIDVEKYQIEGEPYEVLAVRVSKAKNRKIVNGIMKGKRK